EIESERQVILEEKRSRLSPQQRVQEVMLKRLAPGSLIGERLPIGVEETITGVQQQDFKDYWGKWYTPTNTTVVVIADMDPQVVKAEVEKQFGTVAKRPAPNNMDAGVKPYTADGAVVVTDPEIKRAEIGIVKLSPAPAPTTTVGQMRSDLVETIGSWAFNRRLAAKRDEGKVAFLSASASSQVLFRAARINQADVTAEPDKWRDAFRQMATELQRARYNGFTDQEVEGARAELIAQAEVAARREGTLAAGALLQRYNNQINEGEPIMSAQQTLDLLKALLPSITAREVSERFAADYDPTAVMFTAELPADAGDPSGTITEAELVKFGREVLNVKPDREADAARITRLVKEDLAPGKASELTTHASSGVTSFWLADGVRVNHKFIDHEKDAMSVTIALANGGINETADNRGVSSAAAVAFGNPASGAYTSTQIREFMTGRKVAVRGGAGEDAFTLTITGSPVDLETGLQLAHLLLTDPKVEPAALERWRTTQLQTIAERKTQPEGVLGEAIADSFFPAGEVRGKPLTAEQVRRVTAEQAQAWLRGVVAGSPVEVTIVGDLPLELAMPLVEKYLGSLPSRERISATTLDDKRLIKRAPGPRIVERSFPTKTAAAFVLSGFFGPDTESVRDVRLMSLAGQVLSTRMNKTIREERALVYSIGASNQPSVVYPGFGMFVAGARTAREKAKDLGDAVAAAYDAFAAEGPTAEELATAKRQILSTLSENMRRTQWWAGEINSLTYRNRNLDEVMNAPSMIEAVTPADVKAAFNKYYTRENSLRFTVLPDTASPSAGADR
ncbi:MAG TPA: insulinase family protein, partial [Phycisphaerales bacterium]|nr:insulinase family protein [Phycisphaerales bacterium]